ncbi:hypothetical protein ACA910_008462 [Epithemia clementina (nom. ined.)]
MLPPKFLSVFLLLVSLSFGQRESTSTSSNTPAHGRCSVVSALSQSPHPSSSSTRRQFVQTSGTTAASTLSHWLSSTPPPANSLSIPEVASTASVASVGADFGTSQEVGSIGTDDRAVPTFLNSPSSQLERIGTWSPPPVLQSKLGNSRILAHELRPLSQSILLPSFGAGASAKDPDLYYAPFLFGSWKVKATLKQKVYPYGRSFVPFTSLIDGSPRNRQETVDSTTTYEVHYYSTLANTWQNQVTVQLGLGVPQSKIIADRAYNAMSISKAYNQLSPIEQVEWDPSQDPTRLTLQFQSQPVAEDIRPLGPRRGEVYITAHQVESPSSTTSADEKATSTNTRREQSWFACAERSRLVTLAPGTVVVSDTESITEFQPHPKNPNLVKAYNRIAVYLTPNPNSREGVMWQQVQGKAVAFFDYELEMERIQTDLSLLGSDSPGADGQQEPPIDDDSNALRKWAACVPTPKNVLQCE